MSAPSKKYETKVKNIMENTKQTREDIIVPKAIKEEKAAALKAKEERKKQYETQKASNKAEAAKKRESEKSQEPKA